MSETADNDVRGNIFHVQRFSIHDGPGIRTAVFMKGCPLRCAWCHNPEGIDAAPLLSFQRKRCIGCGFCFRVCDRKAHVMIDGHHALRRDLCDVCGSCVKECWAEALELVGRSVTVPDVMVEVIRDKPFYESSGGGLTLSGGEPMAQIEFAKALLTTARREGIRCCMETCGAAPVSSFEEVMPYVDLFLFDIKDMDNTFHLKHTGASNTRILSNLRHLHDHGARVRLRLPIVPGFNDRPDHFAGIASLVGALPNLCGVELMPYHRLGLDKDERLGLSRKCELARESADESLLNSWIERMAALGVHVINQACEEGPSAKAFPRSGAGEHFPSKSR